jgi:hypothetical protein
LIKGRCGRLFQAFSFGDNPVLLKRSLRKLCDYEFEVLLFCDGEPLLENAKQKAVDFLPTLT